MVGRVLGGFSPIWRLVMDEPTRVDKRALDVVPHYHGIWCSIAGGEPFVNTIVMRKWSDDGSRITFMLDTHNFYTAPWDTDIEVVEIEPDVSESTLEMWAASDERSMGARPVCCKACGQTLLKGGS